MSIVFGFGVGVLVETGLVMYTMGVYTVGVLVETDGVLVETDGVLVEIDGVLVETGLVMYTIGVLVETDGVLVEAGGVFVIYAIGMGVFFEPDRVVCIFAGDVVNILDIFYVYLFLLYSKQIQF